MVNVTDTQLQEAEARGRTMLETETRAQAAHYDHATERIVVDLVNGCSYAFPTQLVQDLHGASPDALAEVEVDGVRVQSTLAEVGCGSLCPGACVGYLWNEGMDGSRTCPSSGDGEIAGEGHRGAGKRGKGRPSPEDRARLRTMGGRDNGRF